MTCGGVVLATTIRIIFVVAAAAIIFVDKYIMRLNWSLGCRSICSTIASASSKSSGSGNIRHHFIHTAPLHPTLWVHSFDASPKGFVNVTPVDPVSLQITPIDNQQGGPTHFLCFLSIHEFRNSHGACRVIARDNDMLLTNRQGSFRVQLSIEDFTLTIKTIHVGM